MKKEFANALRDLFTEEMAKKFPEFKPVKMKSQYIWPGERVFCWVVADSVGCYIVLVPSQKGYDEFTVEIGWSKLDRFPEISARGIHVPQPDHSEFARDEFLCRLSSLWGSADFWWQFYDVNKVMSDPVQHILIQTKKLTTAEAEETVLPHVVSAIGKLKEHGIPYLKRYASSFQQH